MSKMTEHYLSVFKQLLPSGSIWEVDPGSDFEKCLRACAIEFSRIHERAAILMLQVDPSTATEMLQDWERILDLPSAGTLTGRQQRVLAEYTQDYSSSVESLVRAARDAGFEIIPFILDTRNRTFSVEAENTLTIQIPKGQFRNTAYENSSDDAIKTLIEEVVDRIQPAHIKIKMEFVNV